MDWQEGIPTQEGYYLILWSDPDVPYVCQEFIHIVRHGWYRYFDIEGGTLGGAFLEAEDDVRYLGPLPTPPRVMF
jgi:hypothetical protein